MKFDVSAIILGFTGSIGSGCSYISKMIPKISSKYKYYKLSDPIREELKKEGNTNPSVEDLQLKGNELRNEYGNEILVRKIIKKIDEEKKSCKHIIIDGIKNDKEVALLKQFPNFFLFSVNADEDVRQKRVVGESKPFANVSEFLEADRRDASEEKDNGQQVKKCNHASDIIIVNEEQFPETAEQQKEDFVRKIYRKYIELIENNVLRKESPEISPSHNELFMSIAYALSKKSSCLKRKVGAVIIEVDKSNTDEHINSSNHKIVAMPSIIASGYNEVPLGSYKCIFDVDFQKCYRDHLQEEHAKKMKHCPNCGHKIQISITCPSCSETYNRYMKSCDKCKTEIKTSYICDKCGNNIFEEHLPGSKNTPGKLLDLCRALHAEEMALLQLSQRGGKKGSSLILFVTTQPCNLCANKITMSGIEKVVYTEPYKMKEAAEILERGNVKLERFEGVKSSAYFRLYH